MKRILLILLTTIMLGSLCTSAQTANRSGFFLELQGGQTIGKVYDGYARESYESDVYMKGGFDLGIGIGYRLAISLNWTFQGKLNITDNLSAPQIGKFISPSALFGMRWTSNDFMDSKSAYVGLNTGCGFYPFISDDIGIYIPIDFEVGINLTNSISLGIFVLPKISIDGYYYDDYTISAALTTHTIAGIRLNYRF